MLPRKGENIYKRKDGRWEGRFIKKNEGTTAKYGYIYGKSYKEVKQKLSEAKSITSSANNTSVSEITFQDSSRNWLYEKKGTVKHSTYIKYKNLLDSYIIPNIGEMNLSSLSYEHLSNLILTLLEKAGKKNNGLSEKTVSDIITVVKSVIKHASRNKCKIDSSALDISVKTRLKPIRVLSQSEQNKLVTLLKDDLTDPFHLGIMISLFTGIRIGELCALTWDDILIDDQIILINKTLQRVQVIGEDHKTKVIISKPKSDCSIRQIPIPDALMSVLNQTIHDSHYVLTHNNMYIEPRTMQNNFKRIMNQCGVTDVSFHTLRHTFATRCIEVGFDIKCLSEILGHANVNITLNRYVHPSHDLKKENMEKLSDLISVK